MTPKLKPNAMMFSSYCSLASLTDAAGYAGKGGHIVDMYDVVGEKLNAKFKNILWKRPITTNTAEYHWKTRTGIPIIIVAHGVGPLATPDGIRRAYHNKHVVHSEGRISPKQFRKLENGGYGDVTEVEIYEEKYDDGNVYANSNAGIINLVILDEQLKSHRKPFSDVLTFDEAVHNKLLHARIGSYSTEFFECLANLARDELRKNGASVNSCILKNSDNPNCRYDSVFLDYPIAHLLDISATEIVPHEHEDYDGRRYHDGLITEISCHERWADARFIGAKNTDITTIHPGIEEVYNNMEANWKKLLVPVPIERAAYEKLYSIIEIGKECFTQYRQSKEKSPQFRIVKKMSVPGVRIFMTSASGKPEFSYNEEEIRKIAPAGANAFQLGDAKLVDRAYEAPIQFYRIEADFSKRILRAEEIRGKHEIIESLTD